MKWLSFITLLLGLLIFSGLKTSISNKQTVSDKIAASYFDDFRNFQDEVTELSIIAEHSQKASNLESLKKQITSTRLAYKKIEFLFDYLQTTYNYLYINGGPLVKNSEESDEPVPPNGLQTLDELIFSDEANNEIDQIVKLAKELKFSVDKISESHLYESISNRRIMEALRSGVIRVFTLGLTGFDTPGSGNAIQEAKVSMQSMNKSFQFYGEALDSASEINYSEISRLYKESFTFLEANDDFDTFDRMAYLKKVVNPLYAELFDFQVSMNIETGQYKFHAQNYNTKNLFNEEFLNTDVFSEFSFLPLNNPKAIKLGKTLFYDPILSQDHKMSCATCHDPKKAFADGLPKSKANVEGKFTQRNAPTLIDVGYSSRYFWDMRDYNLERQVAHVVNNSLEFNTSFGEIANKLSQSEAYVKMFNELYSDIAKKPIYSRSISNAIAAYVNSLKSFDSQFDQFVRNEIDTFPNEAIKGFNLFMGKAACGTCHFAPVFNGVVPPFYLETESEVLGITLGFDTLQPQKDPDPGRIENGLMREQLPHFENSFKTVSVRNASLTAPYMHNGLFETLEEVIAFYNLGGGAGMGLEIENQTLSSDPLNLTENEKQDIITFLHTLTDTTGLTNVGIDLPKFEGRPEWKDRGK